jgi:hypothetical protein
MLFSFTFKEHYCVPLCPALLLPLCRANALFRQYKFARPGSLQPVALAIVFNHYGLLLA